MKRNAEQIERSEQYSQKLIYYMIAPSIFSDISTISNELVSLVPNHTTTHEKQIRILF